MLEARACCLTVSFILSILLSCQNILCPDFRYFLYKDPYQEQGQRSNYGDKETVKRQLC